jgi:acetyl-CoA acetyltransferase
VAGGMESMSQARTVKKAGGYRLGNDTIYDT